MYNTAASSVEVPSSPAGPCRCCRLPWFCRGKIWRYHFSFWGTWIVFALLCLAMVQPITFLTWYPASSNFYGNDRSYVQQTDSLWQTCNDPCTNNNSCVSMVTNIESSTIALNATGRGVYQTGQAMGIMCMLSIGTAAFLATFRLCARGAALDYDPVDHPVHVWFFWLSWISFLLSIPLMVILIVTASRNHEYITSRTGAVGSSYIYAYCFNWPAGPEGESLYYYRSGSSASGSSAEVYAWSATSCQFLIVIYEWFHRHSESIDEATYTNVK